MKRTKRSVAAWSIREHQAAGHSIRLEPMMLGPDKKSTGAGWSAFLFAFAFWKTPSGRPRAERTHAAVDGSSKREVEDRVADLVEGLGGDTAILTESRAEELLQAYCAGRLAKELAR